jgi:hypothetical protein
MTPEYLKEALHLLEPHDPNIKFHLCITYACITKALSPRGLSFGQTIPDYIKSAAKVNSSDEVFSLMFLKGLQEVMNYTNHEDPAIRDIALLRLRTSDIPPLGIIS